MTPLSRNASAADWWWAVIDYEGIKAMAKAIKRPVKDLIALSPANDPFYAAVGHRQREGEWFARLWHERGLKAGMYLRRIHYRLVHAVEDGETILRPDGHPYDNVDDAWQLLIRASLAARYLNLIPFDALTDNRSDSAMLFAPKPQPPTSPTCRVVEDVPDATAYLSEEPDLPTYRLNGIQPTQDYIVEIWVEKSSLNDWLIPFCERRAINLAVGIGEMSETRSRELALRADRYGKPVRVIYISDFDPGGRSMPKAVARKVEFTLQKFGLDVDLRLIPLALTQEQCVEYRLPRTPIKEKERRKDRFEAIFGAGATELDAMEEVHPGELQRLLDEEIDNYLDPGLDERVSEFRWQHQWKIDEIEAAVLDEHAAEIEALNNRYQDFYRALEGWEESASALWQTLAEKMQDRAPDLSDVAVPRPEVSGSSNGFVLFDSRRDYLTQLDHYHKWRDGEV
jgi:hypothetical protein